MRIKLVTNPSVSFVSYSHGVVIKSGCDYPSFVLHSITADHDKVPFHISPESTQMERDRWWNEGFEVTAEPGAEKKVQEIVSMLLAEGVAECLASSP